MLLVNQCHGNDLWISHLPSNATSFLPSPSLVEYLNFGPTHEVLRKSWQCGEARCRCFDWHTLHVNSQKTVSAISSHVNHIIYGLPFWRNGKDGTWEIDYITSYPKELFVVKEDYFRQKIILNVKGIYLLFQSMVMACKNDQLISGEKKIIFFCIYLRLFQ